MYKRFYFFNSIWHSCRIFQFVLVVFNLLHNRTAHDYPVRMRSHGPHLLWCRNAESDSSRRTRTRLHPLQKVCQILAQIRPRPCHAERRDAIQKACRLFADRLDARFGSRRDQRNDMKAVLLRRRNARAVFFNRQIGNDDAICPVCRYFRKNRSTPYCSTGLK